MGLKMVTGILMRGLLLILLAVSAPAMAQDSFPTKTMKWIVPYPPGGIPDRLARAYALKLSEHFGQSVVVENKPGANSLVGGKALAQEPADGHTLLMVTSVVAVGRTLYPGSSWPAHPLDTFAPVSSMIQMANVIVVPASSPYTTIGELIAAAKAKPGTLQYGVPSLGSSVHIGMELFSERSGIKLSTIGFKGGPDLATNLIGGHIGIAADNLTNALPHIQSGKLRALMVMSRARNPVIPNVPSSSDAGFPDFASTSWQGVVVRAGTPQPIVEKLAREIARISALPEIKKMFEERGDSLEASTPAQFEALIREEATSMTAALKRLHITSQ